MTDDKYFIQTESGDLVRFDLINKIFSKKGKDEYNIYIHTKDNEDILIFKTTDEKAYNLKYQQIIHFIDVV